MDELSKRGRFVCAMISLASTRPRRRLRGRLVVPRGLKVFRMRARASVTLNINVAVS
jgi:hypothetical protein